VATAIGAYATASLVKARLFAAGVTDTADDTLIGTICDQVNQFIEGPAGAQRVLAPITSAIYLFDGDNSNYLIYPPGIRAVSLLEIADYTGGAFTTVTSTEYFLRPLAQDRDSPQHPATQVWLGDQGTYRYFRLGWANVRITMTTGWAAIPDDITDVALTTAVRAWHARQSGQADIIGNDDTGAPLVSRYVAPHHRGILAAYRPLVPAH
jgi:hypothetical protein